MNSGSDEPIGSPEGGGISDMAHANFASEDRYSKF